MNEKMSEYARVHPKHVLIYLSINVYRLLRDGIKDKLQFIEVLEKARIFYFVDIHAFHWTSTMYT